METGVAIQLRHIDGRQSGPVVEDAP